MSVISRYIAFKSSIDELKPADCLYPMLQRPALFTLNTTELLKNLALICEKTTVGASVGYSLT